jgi:molybdate transport system substrate-binding protein
LAAGEVQPYAVGRLVLWSATRDARQLTPRASLTDPKITRIAMANPKHAPYGKRAVEALRAVRCVGLRSKSKLVYGENIAHTAQFVQTGNAQVGIIALALAVNPDAGAARAATGWFPTKLHSPAGARLHHHPACKGQRARQALCRPHAQCRRPAR